MYIPILSLKDSPKNPSSPLEGALPYKSTIPTTKEATGHSASKVQFGAIQKAIHIYSWHKYRT